MTSSTTFEDMEQLWEGFAKGSSNIYGKYAEHLALGCIIRNGARRRERVVML
jgi:hypothetical protein